MNYSGPLIAKKCGTAQFAVFHQWETVTLFRKMRSCKNGGNFLWHRSTICIDIELSTLPKVYFILIETKILYRWNISYVLFLCVERFNCTIRIKYEKYKLFFVEKHIRLNIFLFLPYLLQLSSMKYLNPSCDL